MSNILKPCPFCGGEAYFVGGEDDHRIICGGCDIEFTPWGDNPYWTEEYTASKWNRREASGKMCITYFNPNYKRRDGVTE